MLGRQRNKLSQDKNRIEGVGQPRPFLRPTTTHSVMIGKMHLQRTASRIRIPTPSFVLSRSWTSLL